MKILVLDDSNYRHRQVETMFPDDEITSCLDIWAAQNEIAAQIFDTIFLDADLNDYSENSAIITENNVAFYLTGIDFLTFLLTKIPSKNWPKKIIIISIDKDAAQEMMWILDQVGIIEHSWEPLPN